MIRETGCDGVVVGRGCLGRPWLFAELCAALTGNEPPAPPDLGGVLDTIVKHAHLLADFFGEKHGKGRVDGMFGLLDSWLREAVCNEEVLNLVALLPVLRQGAAEAQRKDPPPAGAAYEVLQFKPL